MQLVELRKWRVLSDPDLTREAYARMEVPGSESCGCEACFNFAVVRHLIYTPEVLELFDWLGIDPLLEAEVRHDRRLAEGRHGYTVWFYLVGRIASGPATTVAAAGDDVRPCLERAGRGVGVGFCADRGGAPDVFDGLPVLRLEVSVVAPWVSNAPEPPGWDARP